MFPMAVLILRAIPESLLYNRDLSYNEIIRPNTAKSCDERERVLAARAAFKYEYEITTASGERKWS